MHELLARSDVVSLHLPLTQETRDLIGEAELAVLKQGAILVNTARESERLRGAAFDSFATEPPQDSPLLELDAFVASPHAGAATFEAAERTGVEAVERLVRALREGSVG
jgi:phosphoglycerate dehydrogenase-like enzyme